MAGVHGDALKVQVNAPPVDGAANQAVVEVLAAWLDVPQSAIALVQGQAGRDKLVEIMTDSPAQLTARLRAALACFVDKRQAGG